MTYDLRVLSLGAGVQSTVVYLMAVIGEIEPRPDVAIFADVGWEPRDIYKHLDFLESIGGDVVPINRVSAGNLRDDVLASLGNSGVGSIGHPPFFVRNDASDGTPSADSGGMLWRKCTTDYKIAPIHKEIRRLLGYAKGERVKKKCQQLFGISADEAHRMKDSRVKWIDNVYPLCDRLMTRNDCRGWLRDHGYAEPRKSSCIGCPYHSGYYWKDMHDNHPDEWADAVDFDRRLRLGKLPGVTGDAFLHRKMLPLPEALADTHDLDQLDIFGNECEGMCGV